MKIYTEINYSFDDNGELQVDSEKSFEYDGAVSDCKGGGSSAPPAPEPTIVPFTQNPVVVPQANPYIKQGGIGTLPAGQNVANQMGLPVSTGQGGMLPQTSGRTLPQPPSMAQGPQSPYQMMQPRQRSTPVMGRM